MTDSTRPASDRPGLCPYIPPGGPDVPGDFALEQEVTIAHAEGEGHFRAVLERRGSRVTIVGLGPHGGRGFVLKHQAGRVEFENHMPFDLPFPPAYMLSDIYRTWFSPRAAVSVGGGLPVPSEACERGADTAVDPEVMYESVVDETTVERQFCRLSDSRSGDTGGLGCEGHGITVVYAPTGLPSCAPYSCAPPEESVLRNLDYGYSVTTRTLRWTPIP